MLGNLLRAADLLMKWDSRNKAKDERVCSYVETIADEADELAKVWTSILSELLKEQTIKLGEHPHIVDYVKSPEGWEHSNAPTYSRLEVFYKRLHYVLGDYDQGKADLLLYKLANILSTRRDLRHYLEIQKSPGRLSRKDVALNLGVKRWDRDEIIKLIDLINKQAAEIRSFSLELKARMD